VTTRRPRLLVVDDERAVRSALRVNLAKAGYEVVLAASAEEALALLVSRPPDLVLTDVMMPGLSGHELLARLQNSHPDLPVVIMTGHGSVESAVAAMKAGAADYIIKPVSRAELLVILEKALQTRELEAEVATLRAELDGRYGFENIIGHTSAMQAVYELVDAVADSDALVLLTGPTGTGKELLSRAIHHRSPRRDRPFVAINCAALPEGLLESELFGHEKGAFTGAVRQHLGKFEQADGGTLMLDEIGDIPLSAQVRLLRVLESGELQRVGGRETLRVDVRVIAATNRNLRRAAREGTFREDLYYRLNVFHIPLPPLRDRIDDIPLLVEHFVQRSARRYRRRAREVSQTVLSQLMAYHWPGNVRELEHLIERAVILCQGTIITELKLPEPETEELPRVERPEEIPLPETTDINQELRSLERRLIVEALKREGGVQARAARRLGISRSNLNYRIQKLGISVAEIRYN